MGIAGVSVDPVLVQTQSASFAVSDKLDLYRSSLVKLPCRSLLPACQLLTIRTFLNELPAMPGTMILLHGQHGMYDAVHEVKLTHLTSCRALLRLVHSRN